MDAGKKPKRKFWVNILVWIGNTTVMPGDVVFGGRGGVSFIPPHLVQGIVDSAQITRILDELTKKRFAERNCETNDF